MEEEIIVYGYSIGDDSVGIPSIQFEFNTGLYELDDNQREFIINHIIINIYELHDNGKVVFNFSDEIPKDGSFWDYTRYIDYKKAQEILEKNKE